MSLKQSVVVGMDWLIVRQKWINRLVVHPVRLLARHFEVSEERNFLFFPGLGNGILHEPRGRALVAYQPNFIRFLYASAEVGPMGWNPQTLPGVMDKLSRLELFPFHSMFWETAEIVRQLIHRGFLVDYVCDRHGYLVKDVSCYDLILDEFDNLLEWSEKNPSAKKVFYSTGSHWLFQNQAELTRHQWLQGRRGVDVPIQRQVQPLMGAGVADLITSFGNKRVQETYGCFAPKIRKLWISAVRDDLPPLQRDWSRVRKSFLFFSSGAWVHKGLDLTIEAFLREPSLDLHIFFNTPEAASSKRVGFYDVYGPDLKKAGNITFHNLVNVLTPEFAEVCSQVAGVICPSASEGCSGAVVQALHGGLIPLVTPIVGLELHDEWPALKGSTDEDLIEDIRGRCLELSQMKESELEELSRYCWKFAQTHYTRRSYSESLSRVLDELVGPQ